MANLNLIPMQQTALLATAKFEFQTQMETVCSSISRCMILCVNQLLLHLLLNFSGGAEADNLSD